MSRTVLGPGALSYEKDDIRDGVLLLLQSDLYGQ